MNAMNFFANQQKTIKSQPEKKLSDRNKKTRLILLTCQLLAINLGLKGQQTPARISIDALTKKYIDEEVSSSPQGAKKAAIRDMKSIGKAFGFHGNKQMGYQLAMSFEPPKAYLQMFEYWLEYLNTNTQSPDTVLKVMLEGLIDAIKSAFSSDPISIPNLAHALKEKYDKSNVRDTRKPLKQLFDDRAMAHFLPLETVSEKVDTYKVDTKLEPLLMRKASRDKVGGNEDDTLILARAGLIRSRIYNVLKDEPDTISQQIMRLAEAVEKMEQWEDDDQGACIPYALHLNQHQHEYVLVIYWEGEGSYQDVPVTKIGSIPSAEYMLYYCPEEFTVELWNQWKSLSYWHI